MTDDLKLAAGTTALVVVDVQERLLAAMPEGPRDRCVRSVDLLLETARLFHMPVLVTEQYPKGLGHTAPVLKERLAQFAEPPKVLEKTEFDANENPDFSAAFDHLITNRGEGAIRSVIVCGMEAHICVYQTVRGFRGGGYRVYVPYDATCSRNEDDRRVAESLWRATGAVSIPTEAILFDLLGSAKHEHFRAISKLLR